jgi:hypothetical protein
MANQLQKSATEPYSTWHYINFYTVCWMYLYRLQRNGITIYIYIYIYICVCVCMCVCVRACACACACVCKAVPITGRGGFMTTEKHRVWVQSKCGCTGCRKLNLEGKQTMSACRRKERRSRTPWLQFQGRCICKIGHAVVVNALFYLRDWNSRIRDPMRCMIFLDLPQPLPKMSIISRKIMFLWSKAAASG